MTADAAAAALDVARFDARQNSRHEDLAGDERGPAEFGEWERIARLLADATPGTVYDPDTDDVVQAELAADAAREAELREAKACGTPVGVGSGGMAADSMVQLVSYRSNRGPPPVCGAAACAAPDPCVPGPSKAQQAFQRGVHAQRPGVCPGHPHTGVVRPLTSTSLHCGASGPVQRDCVRGHRYALPALRQIVE
ncbi:hypothetical protein ACH4K8_37100, partial [Streptomyces anulatus]